MIRMDYFIGRTVAEIIPATKGWDWALVLDGNVVIRNKDTARTTTPVGTIGATVIQVITETDGSRSVCCGGAGRIPDGTYWSSAPDKYTFTPGKHTISTPDHPEELAPSTPPSMTASVDMNAVMAQIPPHPDERVAEGPEEVVNGQAGEEQAGAQAEEARTTGLTENRERAPEGAV